MRCLFWSPGVLSLGPLPYVKGVSSQRGVERKWAGMTPRGKNWDMRTWCNYLNSRGKCEHGLDMEHARVLFLLGVTAACGPGGLSLWRRRRNCLGVKYCDVSISFSSGSAKKSVWVLSYFVEFCLRVSIAQAGPELTAILLPQTLKWKILVLATQKKQMWYIHWWTYVRHSCLDCIFTSNFSG